ncbi:MAG: 2-oxoacid:acceptor oxidoreductase family protein [Chloroflexota bacterium]|nr:2-oxoacid:acceptor oxidoreductase family protein [Chloroflexota bacterium]
MAQKVAHTTEVMVAGMGGQGLLTTGKLLAEAAMARYKHVLYFPNYGPMMRGGESECTITLSDEVIGSHATYHPQTAIVMGPEAFTQFQGRIKPGGTLFVDSSVIAAEVERKDITAYYIPATALAMEMGGKQVANLILLGAFAEATGAVPLELIENAIERKMKGSRGEALLELNKKALREGARQVAGARG